jgi:hypothetical protein
MLNCVVGRRMALRAGLGFAAALALPSARACEYFAPNLRITHPWARATAHGDSFAIVSMKFDNVTCTDRLIGVETPVAAGAELGGAGTGSVIDIAIPQGLETLLTDTGTHVRLVGLLGPLQVARSYPLKLSFEMGGVVNATLNIDYARFG